MRELSNQCDIHTWEARLAITKMLMKLFALWQITTVDQAALLNRSLSTIRRYQNGGCFADVQDMHDRVASLLGVHKSLRIVYPHNRDLVYRWVSTTNKAFDGKAPIELM